MFLSALAYDKTGKSTLFSDDLLTEMYCSETVGPEERLFGCAGRSHVTEGQQSEVRESS